MQKQNKREDCLLQSIGRIGRTTPIEFDMYLHINVISLHTVTKTMHDYIVNEFKLFYALHVVFCVECTNNMNL